MREYLEQLLLVLAVGSGVAIVAKRISVPYNVALVVVGLLLVLMNVLPRDADGPGGRAAGVPADPGLPGRALRRRRQHAPGGAADPGAGPARRGGLAARPPPPSRRGRSACRSPSRCCSAPSSRSPTPSACCSPSAACACRTGWPRSWRARACSTTAPRSCWSSVAATVVVAGGFADPPEIARMLVIAIVAGALLGAAFGMLGALVLRRAPDDLTRDPRLARRRVRDLAPGRAARRLGGDRRGRRRRAHRARDAGRGSSRRACWRCRASGRLPPSCINVVAVPARRHAAAVGPAAARGLADRRSRWSRCTPGRAVAVYGCFGALRLAGDAVPWRWQHVMVFGNVKGALSMAAVLALPAGHAVPRAADRDRLRRHAGHAGHAGAAVPPLPHLARGVGRRRRRAARTSAAPC